MIRLWTFQKKVTIAFAVLVGFVALTTRSRFTLCTLQQLQR